VILIAFGEKSNLVKLSSINHNVYAFNIYSQKLILSKTIFWFQRELLSQIFTLAGHDQDSLAHISADTWVTKQVITTDI